MDSDIEIVERKNKEQKKLKLVNAMLIIGLILALATLVFVLVIARYQPPQETPRIKVLERTLVDGKYGLTVPSEITVGKLFSYQAEGEKFVDNNPEVRLQTVCQQNGAQSIQTIATFTSIGVPKGKFKINRSTTVTPSTKNVASDNCELQSLATYTFYTVDKSGNESSFQVTETARSNPFKLIVPANSDEMSVVAPVQQPNGTTPTSSLPQNLNVAQSQSAPLPTQSQTTIPQPQNETPNGVIPEQPETRFIRRTVNGLLDIVGL